MRPHTLARILALTLIFSLSIGFSLRAWAQDDESSNYVLDAVWNLPLVPAQPMDIALAADGRLFVADAAHNAVLSYDADGGLIGRWTLERDDEFYVPACLAFSNIDDKLYSLWIRFEEGPDGPEFKGVYLDTRRPWGEQVRPLQSIGFLDWPADMALGASGELWVSSGTSLKSIIPSSGWMGKNLDVGDAKGIAGQIAVLDNERLAIVRPSDAAVDIMTIEGIPVGRIEIQEASPLALTGDGTGDLFVLVRADNPDDPGAPVLLRYGSDGERKDSFSAGRLGAPSQADIDWPWAVAAAPSALALTSGHARYHTLSYDENGQSRIQLVGREISESYTPRPAQSRSRPPLRLATDSQGRLIALDGQEDRLLRFDTLGRSQMYSGTPSETLDIAIGIQDEVYASTSFGKIQRFPGKTDDSIRWEKDCDCDLGGSLAASPAALYVSRPRQQGAGTYNLADGLGLRSYIFPEGVGLWPSDVAVSHEGRLYTADMVAGQVQGWSSPDKPDVVWQAGILAGPRHIAAGRDADGNSLIGAIMADGHVELHQARHGRLVARWLAKDPEDKAFDMSDIALGDDGAVYIADAGKRKIYVYRPGLGIPPIDPPTPAASPTPSDRSCTITGDKVAAQSPVVLGHQTGITLTLAAECPDGSRSVGADIAIILDKSGSMRGQKLEAAKGAARGFAELLDIRYHRIGLVSFSRDAVADVELGDDIGAFIDGLAGLEPEGQTNMGAALQTAQAMLERGGREDALPVLILLTDGDFTAGGDDPRDIAAAVRAAGMQIYTIGLGSGVSEEVLQSIAGSPERYFHAPNPGELYPIYGQILREVVTSLAGNLLIDDRLSDSVQYVEQSANPAALESEARLRWSRNLLPRTGITMTYAVTATLAGCHPSNISAVADYIDGDGIPRQYVFPEPTICVITPSPTPTKTATPTASPTPSASPTPVPIPIYLPILNGCRPAAHPVDVVLLIDNSSSMSGGKLEQAQSAAQTFVRLIDLQRDQAAIVGFDANARLAAPLSRNLAALESAISGLELGSGTRIDRAINAAVAELLSHRRAPGNQGVIILLSDGAHAGTSADLGRAVREAKALGALIYGIGLGADVDMDQIREIAGPERSYYAPDGEALRKVYEAIAVSIPCR